MSCPAAWEDFLRLVHPVMVADSTAMEDSDHEPDGSPILAWEWDII